MNFSKLYDAIVKLIAAPIDVLARSITWNALQCVVAARVYLAWITKTWIRTRFQSKISIVFLYIYFPIKSTLCITAQIDIRFRPTEITKMVKTNMKFPIKTMDRLCSHNHWFRKYEIQSFWAFITLMSYFSNFCWSERYTLYETLVGIWPFRLKWGVNQLCRTSRSRDRKFSHFWNF